MEDEFKNRTDVELLVILKEYIEFKGDKFICGLCYNNIMMYYKGLISRIERDGLDKIIRDNRPNGVGDIKAFYWDSGVLQPRLKWCDEMIEKYK